MTVNGHFSIILAPLKQVLRSTT